MRNFIPDYSDVLVPAKGIYINSYLTNLSLAIFFYVLFYLLGGLKLIFFGPGWLNIITIPCAISLGLVIISSIGGIYNTLNYPSRIDLRNKLINKKTAFSQLVITHVTFTVPVRSGYKKLVNLFILYTEKDSDDTYQSYGTVSSDNEYFDELRNFAIKNNIYLHNFNLENYTDQKKLPNKFHQEKMSISTTGSDRKNFKINWVYRICAPLVYGLLYYVFIHNYKEPLVVNLFNPMDVLRFLPFRI